MTRPFGDRIRVGVLSQNGHFILNLTVGGNLKLTGGYEASFLNMLMKGLHSQPVFYTAEKDEWGKQTEDGNWTGLIGMVYRKEVDMAVSTLLITQSRMEVVDFSYPYTIEDITFATQLPGIIPTATALIGPFSLDLWLGLVASLIVFPMIAYILLLKKFTFGEIILNLFGNILNQPLTVKTHYIKDRIVLGAWLCGVVFLSKTYSSFLLSFLTLPIRQTPIKDVNQLSKAIVAGTYKCYTTKGSSILRSLFSSPQENIVSIAKAIKDNNWLLESQNNLFVKYAVEKNSAIIRTRRYINNILQDNVFISDDSFYAGYAAVVLPKSSPLKIRINKLLSIIEASGVYSKSSEHFLFLRHLNKRLQAGAEENDIKGISLVDLEEAFIILISGYIFAVVVFFLEVVWGKIRGKDFKA